MKDKTEQTHNIDDIKVTISGKEIKGISSMKYKDTEKEYVYVKLKPAEKTYRVIKVILIIILIIQLIAIFRLTLK